MLSLKIPKINCPHKRELQDTNIDIACNNWHAEFPYSPLVDATIAHDGNCIYLHFRVLEDCSMALVTNDNGEVWTDSCVEFFISFDDSGYYNFELNCIGTTLLAFRKERPNPTYASQQIMANIRRSSTLGDKPFGERVTTNNEKISWELNIKIPKESFFLHDLKTLDGIVAKGNFFKCGDNLSKPHFLSWGVIDAPSPNFHIERCFGTLEFE